MFKTEAQGKFFVKMIGLSVSLLYNHDKFVAVLTKLTGLLLIV